MTESHFDIVYKGEIIAPDRPQVITAFAELFKIDVDKATAVLSAKQRRLKKSVSEIQARQYIKKLSEIGVLVHMEPAVLDVESLITLEPEVEPEAAKSELLNAVVQGSASAEEDQMTEDRAANLFDKSKMSIVQPESSSVQTTDFSLIEDPGRIRRLNFSFTGKGAEFFKIWIVNVCLSVITLGIYSAWAKVRTNRYFYSNTWLDNAAFEYLADPLSILKGRIIAVVLFGGYVVSQSFFPLLSLILGVLIFILLPWFVVQSLRFRMRYTAYRNIRFNFEGSIWGAVKAYNLMFLLLPLTLFLLMPYMIFAQARYRVENTRYGVDCFSFNVSPREYYRIYILAFFALLAVGFVAVLCSMASPLFGGLVALAGYSLVITFVTVETLNLLFDNTHLGDHRFSSSLEIWPYFYVYFVNTLLIILTLGLFYPWAKVRIARYRFDNIMMIAQGGLNYYVQAQQQETSAIGEEVGNIFDFDIGF